MSYEGEERVCRFARIRRDMAQFVQRVSDIGYNAVSLDDLAHLADHSWYEPEIRRRIGVCREEFRRIFSIVEEQGLAIYLTMDVCSYTPALEQRLGGSPGRTLDFLKELIDRFFSDFPMVAGLIVRIGESDGESDFFRYLPLNQNFFRTRIPKIIELQARREYEGCGEYPSFIGWDYQHYAQQLGQAPNMLGISVWCQTGGWVPFRRLAYIGEGSLWTEHNAYVTLKIFRDRCSVERAVQALAGQNRYAAYLELFRLSDEVIKELLYIEEFARQKLFFLRVRIPPLIGVYWNTIFISHSLRKIIRYFVHDPETCTRTGYGALAKISRMKVLAEELRLPVDDIVYMKRTFKLLALARQYFFYPYDEAQRKRLKKAKRKYKKAYPAGTRPRYAIRLDFKPFRLHGRFLHWGVTLLLRRRRGYRLIDYVFTIHFLSVIYRIVRSTRSRWIPKFARKRAMGVDTIFR